MEARLGWNRAVAAAREFETWIVCGDHNRSFIEKETSVHGTPDRLNIEYVSVNPDGRMLAAAEFDYRAYHDWHKRVFHRVSELHKQRPFALTHQVGLCGYREPGYLWKLDVPFVWGPVGGTQNLPLRYLPLLDPGAAALEAARCVVNHWHLRYRHRVRMAASKATKIFAANSTTQRDFERVYPRSVELQLETGLLELPPPHARENRHDEPLRILWAGRLRPWKGFPILLKAIRDTNVDVRVRVIGRESIEDAQQLAQQHDVNHLIDWIGWPDYTDVSEHYHWADVFAFTSLRDTSGTGLVESIAHGCPLIGIDHQGAHDVMEADCAIPIPVSNPRETVRAFARAFETLADDRDRLDAMRTAARDRAGLFLWDRLNERMLEVYRSIVLLPDTEHGSVSPSSSPALQ